jgi:S1-C subfamily serine protease
MFKLSKNLSSISISTILITCLIPSVFAQSPSNARSTNIASATKQNQIVSDQPWLVTVVHEINLSEIQKSLLQKQIKMDFKGNFINFRPINITTGVVIDKQHILTRLVNIIPEAGEEARGIIKVVLPSGEERPARFIGLDGPSGFCLLLVDNLDIQPAQLVDNPNVGSDDALTLLNVEFNDKPVSNTKRLDKVQQLGRSILSQSTKVVQFFNRAFFSVTFSNNAKNTPLSFGVVVNNDKQVIGIPETAQNNLIQVFSAAEARRAAKRIIERQGNVPRGWLGVGGGVLSLVSADKLNELGILNNANGFYIDSIVPSSPAEKSGLREDDVIVSLNGEALQKDADAQLFSYVSLQPAGETIEFEVWRNKKLQKIKVTLGERGYASPFVKDPIEEEAQNYFTQKELVSIESSLKNFQDIYNKLTEDSSNQNSIEKQKELVSRISFLQKERRKILELLKRSNRSLYDQELPQKFLGIKVEDLPDPPPNPDPTKPQKFPHGVKVTEVIANSLADSIGIKKDDILLQIGSLLTGTREELITVLSLVKTTPGNQYDVAVTRNNQPLNLKLTLNRPTPKTQPFVQILTEEERQKMEKEQLEKQNKK